MIVKRGRGWTSEESQGGSRMARGVTLLAGMMAMIAILACGVGGTPVAPTADQGVQAGAVQSQPDRVSAAGLEHTAGSDPCGIFPTASLPQNAPPSIVIDRSKSYAAFIVTSKGTMIVDLFADAAPETVNNFMFLSCNGFYDGLTFHRVLPGFMLQGGDPIGDGTGGPGYTIQDEFSQSDLSFDKPGLISMAHSSAPNSAGSQFFITYSVEQTQHLSGAFTIFGELADQASMDVALSITPRDPSDPSSLSITPDTIETIIIRQMN